MSTVAEFGAFKRAVEQGQRVGVSREAAIHAVARSAPRGATGYHVAGQYQHAAMRSPRRPTDGPGRVMPVFRIGMRVRIISCARNDAVARRQPRAPDHQREELRLLQQFRRLAPRHRRPRGQKAGASRSSRADPAGRSPRLRRRSSARPRPHARTAGHAGMSRRARQRAAPAPWAKARAVLRALDAGSLRPYGNRRARVGEAVASASATGANPPNPPHAADVRCPCGGVPAALARFAHWGFPMFELARDQRQDRQLQPARREARRRQLARCRHQGRTAGAQQRAGQLRQEAARHCCSASRAGRAARHARQGTS